MNNTSQPSKRGFAAMSPDQHRELASKGGKAAHAKGSAHKWTHEEAIAAGRKGGLKHTRQHLSTIGQNGGKASATRRATIAPPPSVEDAPTVPRMEAAPECDNEMPYHEDEL